MSERAQAGQSEASSKELKLCEAREPLRGLACHCQYGHTGVHMHFTANSTTAWGLASVPPHQPRPS